MILPGFSVCLKNKSFEVKDGKKLKGLRDFLKFLLLALLLLGLIISLSFLKMEKKCAPVCSSWCHVFYDTSADQAMAEFVVFLVSKSMSYILLVHQLIMVQL